MTLVEAMVSLAVLALGLLGVLASITVASGQNVSAMRQTQAASLARRALVGVKALGRERVVGAAGLFSRCSTDAEVHQLAGPLASVATPPPCIVDLDAHDRSVPGPLQIDPSYPAGAMAPFRRVLVRFATGNGLDNVAVVISWQELGRRRFLQEFVGFYDASMNQSGAEI